MKKIFLLVAFVAYYCVSAQGDVYLQNYTPYQVEFTLLKSDQTNISGGCTPRWDAGSSVTGLLLLKQAQVTGLTASEAYYKADLNQSNTFNSAYPLTPQIDTWILNGNTASPYVLPTSTIPYASGIAAKNTGFKFGLKDPATGTNVAGYFPIGYQGCGVPSINDISAYTNQYFATYLTVGGVEWFVFF